MDMKIMKALALAIAAIETVEGHIANADNAGKRLATKEFLSDKLKEIHLLIKQARAEGEAGNVQH